MARKKFSSKAVLSGRNMLITEYLWIYHWLRHPPAPGEYVPVRKQREDCNNGKPHKMFRTRKQVSSHIQVLKHFFQSLPTCKRPLSSCTTSGTKWPSVHVSRAEYRDG